ncbi:MAG: thioredoxin-dependent thiol peroxidase [Candidatus Sericytochromatia bacterium]
MLEIGNKAPDFLLKDQNNNDFKLSDNIGKKIVVYFYPKDDTPGCTKEACSFRDNFEELKNKDILIVGISPDNNKSHTKFIEKYKLPFTLLSDENKEVLNLYNAYGEKNMYGKITMGVLRKTYLIDEKGNIVHIFKKPKTDIHAQEVLEKFSKL